MSNPSTPHIIHRLHENRKIDLGLGMGEDDTVELTHKFTPHNIVPDAALTLLRSLPESLKIIAREMMRADWNIYVVNQTRGRCYYRAKTITIPAWATSRDRVKPGYSIWYTAHEFAHAYTVSDMHGDRFMDRLIQTCPPEFIHYELGYKPRNAARAGIIDPRNLGF